MQTTPGKPATNSHRAAEELRALIFSGELPAGSNHLETELAARLQMSRTPIREAALTLEAQGLVELKPRKGVRILGLSAEDMAEVYDILTELESLAAHQAAMKGYGPLALAPLTQAISDMEAALGSDDLRAWADADDRFHSELVKLGGNSRVEMIVGMMADQVRRARSMTLFMRPKPSKSNSDHRQVLDAIASGDADAARAIHHAHRTEAKKIILALLETHQLRTV